MCASSCGGFTLLEVMVALLILSIGLLGLATLQTTSLRFNTGAYYRTQATALAYDLADRMRANREAAVDGAYDDVNPQDPAPACLDVAPPGATVAEADIEAWRNALACALPLGTGDVNRGADNRFTITVLWDESRGEAIVGEPVVFGASDLAITAAL